MIKKLLKEFKEFALKGSVIDLAVGVIIGAAFGKVVTAVIDIFLQPLLDSLPKLETGGTGFVGSIALFVFEIMGIVRALKGSGKYLPFIKNLPVIIK